MIKIILNFNINILCNSFKCRVLSLLSLLQVDAKEDESTNFIFMSDDAMASEKLMILIHGSGVVRAGQWARRYDILES